MSALPPIADIVRLVAPPEAPNSLKYALVYVVFEMSWRLQAFRGASRGRTNVDFDSLYFDCRSW
jgi:hypothetical protein